MVIDWFILELEYEEVKSLKIKKFCRTNLTGIYGPNNL